MSRAKGRLLRKCWPGTLDARVFPWLLSVGLLHAKDNLEVLYIGYLNLSF